MLEAYSRGHALSISEELSVDITHNKNQHSTSHVHDSLSIRRPIFLYCRVRCVEMRPDWQTGGKRGLVCYLTRRRPRYECSSIYLTMCCSNSSSQSNKKTKIRKVHSISLLLCSPGPRKNWAEKAKIIFVKPMQPCSPIANLEYISVQFVKPHVRSQDLNQGLFMLDDY